MSGHLVPLTQFTGMHLIASVTSKGLHGKQDFHSKIVQMEIKQSGIADGIKHPWTTHDLNEVILSKCIFILFL